jgi:hypothetical protein
MRQFGLVVAVSLAMLVAGRANVAFAQDPCCHHPHHPILRATAVAIRGTVWVLMTPVRLVFHHHHHGCCGYGYGDEGVVEYGPTDALPAGEVVAPGAAAPAAVYAPIVNPESIDNLSAEECRTAAQQAIGRGLVAYRQGQIDVARAYFHEAAVLTPDAASTWALCGVAAAAADDAKTAAVCATHARLITAGDATQRSSMYKTLAPIQGKSRLAFEQLVNAVGADQSIQNIASAQ